MNAYIPEGASNIARVISNLYSSSANPMWTNGEQQSTFVVTCVDLMCWSGAEGNYAGVYYYPRSGITVGLIAGQIGAGNLDNFHYSGEFPVDYNQGLSLWLAGGQWSVSVAGYYTPTYVGSV